MMKNNFRHLNDDDESYRNIDVVMIECRPAGRPS